ncbi:hypothetical protein NUSPORA_01907 [Nucleospora cyclopteri]
MINPFITMKFILMFLIIVEVAESPDPDDLNFAINLDEDKSTTPNTTDSKKDIEKADPKPNPKTDDEQSVSNEFQVVRSKTPSKFGQSLLKNVKTSIKNFGSTIKESLSDFATGIEVQPHLNLSYIYTNFANRGKRLISIFYNVGEAPLETENISIYKIDGIFNVFLPNQIFGPYFVKEFENSFIYDPFADGCCGYYSILLNAYTAIQRLGKDMPVINTAQQRLLDIIDESKKLLIRHTCFEDYSYKEALKLVAFFKSILYVFIRQNINKYYNILGLLPTSEQCSNLSDAQKRSYIKRRFFEDIGDPSAWLDGNILPVMADVLEAEIKVWNLNNYNDELKINSMSFGNENSKVKLEILFITRAKHFLAIKRH